MTTVLTEAGLLEIPEVFRRVDALQPGQPCEIERVGERDYRVTIAQEPRPEGTDLVTWLLACPEKDWWVETNRNERGALKPSTLFDE
jgi:hypothetical protein